MKDQTKGEVFIFHRSPGGYFLLCLNHDTGNAYAYIRESDGTINEGLTEGMTYSNYIGHYAQNNINIFSLPCYGLIGK